MQLDTVAYPHYLSTHYPGASSLPLSLPSDQWSSTALVRHLHRSTLAAKRRRFAVSSLRPPPPVGPRLASKDSRVLTLMAKSPRRIVVPSISSRSLFIYDLKEGPAGVHGESQIDRSWEVLLGSDSGEPDVAPITLTTDSCDASRTSTPTSDDETSGTGNLLTKDVTGIAFVPAAWRIPLGLNEKDNPTRPDVVALAFGNGVVQVIQLPSRSKSSRRRRGKKASESPSAPPPGLGVAQVLATLAHPRSPIQSLSQSSGRLLVTAYTGLVTEYLSPTQSSTFHLNNGSRPQDGLFEETSRYIAIGGRGRTVNDSLFIYDVSQAQVEIVGRHLLPYPRNLSNTSRPAVNALSASPAAPRLLVSAWSSPSDSIAVHDLRTPDRLPVLTFADRIAGLSFYSCTSSFLGSAGGGGLVMGGMASGRRVGIWDARMGRRGGWTIFIPGSDKKRDNGGGVGVLSAEGGRLWGVTPEAPFTIDFALDAVDEEGIVRYYEHAGGRTISSEL